MFSNKETEYAYKVLTSNVYNAKLSEICVNAAELSQVYMESIPDCEVPYIGKIRFEEIFEMIIRR